MSALPSFLRGRARYLLSDEDLCMLIERAQASGLVRISEGAKPEMPSALHLIRAGLVISDGELTEPGKMMAEAIRRVVNLIGRLTEWPEDR